MSNCRVCGLASSGRLIGERWFYRHDQNCLAATGAYYLGVLGAALAAPAATQRCVDISNEDCDRDCWSVFNDDGQ